MRIISFGSLVDEDREEIIPGIPNGWMRRGEIHIGFSQEGTRIYINNVDVSRLVDIPQEALSILVDAIVASNSVKDRDEILDLTVMISQIKWLQKSNLNNKLVFDTLENVRKQLELDLSKTISS